MNTTPAYAVGLSASASASALTHYQGGARNTTKIQEHNRKGEGVEVKRLMVN
jgi:hypothetical protein